MSDPDTLIIVLAARISEWHEKGELSQGYFNPAGRFKNLIIISLVSDDVDDAALAYLAGDTAWQHITLPLLNPSGLLKTLGFSPFFIRQKLRHHLLPQLPPCQPVIRAYGDGLAGMIAAVLGDILECRSVASIHTTVTIQPDGPTASMKLRLLDWLDNRARHYAHQYLDAMAPVYSPALQAVEPKWHGKCHIIPNAVSLPEAAQKTNYTGEKTLKLVTVGRLVTGKAPWPLLQGLSGMRDWQLDVIGDGPEAPALQEFARDAGIEDKVHFIPRLDNATLVQGLAGYDAFLGYTAFAEIPKTVIEAGLIGLPLILNRPVGDLPPEYEDAPILWCDSGPEGYAVALQVLKDHPDEKSDIGLATRAHFSHWFDPGKAGQAMADLLSAGDQYRSPPMEKY